MEPTPRYRSQRQALINLDVGGTLFRISLQSLERYPESLLAKMVREFSQLVEQYTPLFVDRHPKLFEWITEIYRDGDYVSCIPVNHKELLQKELDFYQLPSLEALGIATGATNRAFSKEEARKQLFQQILTEIEASGLKGMFSWEVYIYYVVQADKAENERRVCVRVPRGMRLHSMYYNQSVHSDFFRAMQLENGPPECVHERVIYPASEKQKSYALPLKTDDVTTLIRDAAAEYGMFVLSRVFSQPIEEGRQVTVSCIALQYVQ